MCWSHCGEALRRREIFVAGAHRCRDPDEDLPGDFDTTREVHYAAIRQPTDPTAFITGLRRMTTALAGLDSALVDRTAGGVAITTRRGEPWISIPKLTALPEPGDLAVVKVEVIRPPLGHPGPARRAQGPEFPTEFSTEFTSVASREVIDRDTLRRRLLLCLFALGTNMGIKAIVATGEHGETEPALRHVRRHHITPRQPAPRDHPAGQRHVRRAGTELHRHRHRGQLRRHPRGQRGRVRLHRSARVPAAAAAQEHRVDPALPAR